jgi:hypothetical protein
MRSWEHATGTKYLRSDFKHLIAIEMTIFSPSDECASARKAVILVGIALSLFIALSSQKKG